MNDPIAIWLANLIHWSTWLYTYHVSYGIANILDYTCYFANVYRKYSHMSTSSNRLQTLRPIIGIAIMCVV